VDGVKYFDRDEDPDDVRLRVSPTQELDTYIEQETVAGHAHEVATFDELFRFE